MQIKTYCDKDFGDTVDLTTACGAKIYVDFYPVKSWGWTHWGIHVEKYVTAIHCPWFYAEIESCDTDW